jgi:hypothetical protein
LWCPGGSARAGGQGPPVRPAPGGPKWIYGLLLLGLVPYVLGVAFTTRRATLGYFLCAGHARTARLGKRTAILLAGLGALAGIGSILLESIFFGCVAFIWALGAGIAAVTTDTGSIHVEIIEGDLVRIVDLPHELVAHLPPSPPAPL